MQHFLLIYSFLFRNMKICAKLSSDLCFLHLEYANMQSFSIHVCSLSRNMKICNIFLQVYAFTFTNMKICFYNLFWFMYSHLDIWKCTIFVYTFMVFIYKYWNIRLSPDLSFLFSNMKVYIFLLFEVFLFRNIKISKYTTPYFGFMLFIYIYSTMLYSHLI